MKNIIILVAVLITCNSCSLLNQIKDKQDLDYLVSAIKENYPFLQVHLRRDGFNWNEYIVKLDQNTNQRTNNVNKIEYYSKYLHGLNGHVHFLTEDIFPIYYDIYQNNLEKYPELLPWCKILNDPRVKNIYNYTKINIHNKTIKLTNSVDFIKTNGKKYVYIKVPSFEDELKISEGPKIIEYLKENSNKDKIIIFDISGNSGGSTFFWEDFIVRPLISTNITTLSIELFKGGKLSLPFIDSENISLIDISKFDQKIEYIDDLKLYKYFSKTERCLEPINSGIKYKKIVVIMDEYNFSASDAFLDFCKQSHFAILVGQNSTGDGIGFDPILIQLPNSNLVFTIPVSLGLNSDGSINYEKGITPDIPIDKSINTLNYILNKIDEF